MQHQLQSLACGLVEQEIHTNVASIDDAQHNRFQPGEGGDVNNRGQQTDRDALFAECVTVVVLNQRLDREQERVPQRHYLQRHGFVLVGRTVEIVIAVQP